jgi:hypothetical protein
MKNLSKKVQVLFEGANNSGNIPVKEYASNQAENDPNFFRWLFDEDFENDWDRDLTPEQESEYKEFLETLN